MNHPINRFKQALQAGQPQIGLWASLSSHYATEVIAGAGFDWILLDTEHSPNNVPMVHMQLQAMMESTTTPIVRVPWNDPVILKRTLDIGVQTVLIPFVQNAEEARLAVAACKYPPEGTRGVATTIRANRFGRVKDYHKNANAQICVLVQVETRSAWSNLMPSQQRPVSMGYLSVRRILRRILAISPILVIPRCKQRSPTASRASVKRAKRRVSSWVWKPMRANGWTPVVCLSRWVRTLVCLRVGRRRWWQDLRAQISTFSSTLSFPRRRESMLRLQSRRHNGFPPSRE